MGARTAGVFRNSGSGTGLVFILCERNGIGTGCEEEVAWVRNFQPLRELSRPIPNMTPMVDVVMCILIFFMLASSILLPERVLKNTLPAITQGIPGSVSANAPLPPVRMFIRLSRREDETWVAAFGEQPLKMGSPNAEIYTLFAHKAAVLSPDVQLTICPEADVPYQDIITLYDYCVGVKFRAGGFCAAALIAGRNRFFLLEE